jgi:hypothetical protein
MARSARFGIVSLVVVLVAILALIPIVKGLFPRSFEGFQDPMTDMRIQQLLSRGREDSANPDCIGVTCPEGSFCQKNQCHPIYPK